MDTYNDMLQKRDDTQKRDVIELSNNSDQVILDPKRNTEKCIVCNKKSIFNIDCLCGNMLCLKHRGYEFHMCDYRISQNKQPIVIERIVPVKLQKI
jgi:hypothetical protein